MQFGLLYECRRPFTGTEIDWNTLYKETLAQCELADQVGFNNLWFVEHHFLTGFSGSPSQDALFGALSRLPSRSASATACASCPTITPCVSPSAWPYWTSSPMAASSWARPLQRL